MEMDLARQQLQAAGLIVRPMRYGLWVSVRCASEIEDGCVDVAGELASLWDGSQIRYEAGFWAFEKWCYIPGPGPDDIHFTAETLTPIVQAVLNCYFGEPVILNKWILPLHKHPEWNLDRLKQVVESAKPIPFEEWQTIHEDANRRSAKFYPGPILSQIEPYLFNPIAHSENPDLTLYLCRDLSKAFIVNVSSPT